MQCEPGSSMRACVRCLIQSLWWRLRPVQEKRARERAVLPRLSHASCCPCPSRSYSSALSSTRQCFPPGGAPTCLDWDCAQSHRRRRRDDGCLAFAALAAASVAASGAAQRMRIRSRPVRAKSGEPLGTLCRRRRLCWFLRWFWLPPVFCVPSQWQQMDSPHAQQVPVCEASFNRLVIKPDWFKDSEAKLEALGRASSSAGYPGSRGDVAAAKRYYTKDDNNQLISELAMIRAKEGVNRNVESAKWTYPGWRADTAKVFDKPLMGRTTTPLDVQTAVKSMDRKQGLHEKLPPSVFSSAWTSFRSDVDYAFRFTDRNGDVSSVIFTFGPTLALSTWFLSSTDSTLSKLGCDTSWRKWEVQGCALAATGILALTASSSIGFLPLVFAGTYCGLQAVSLHEEDTP